MKTIIRKFKIDSRIRVGYGSAFFLLLISYLLTLFTNRQLLNQAGFVDNSNKIITYIDEILSDVKDGETGLRGYIVTKDQRFLDPYYTSRVMVDSAYIHLRSFIPTDGIQNERLDSLRFLIDRKFRLMQMGMTAFVESNFEYSDTLRNLTYLGKHVMDSIRSVVSRMKFHQEDTLRLSRGKMNARFTALNTIIIVSLIIALLFFIFGYITYVRENRARRSADEKVQGYQEQLKQRINELAAANQELQQMRSQEKFAATGRIARTIAHEVRNPLTNINLAIEQIISEMSEIDENSQLLFDMVSRNSNRINQLITDLLNSTKFAELNYVRTSINVLLDEALAMAEDRIALHNVMLEKHYSMDICDVSVDKERIKIAFLNIIVNALEAMVPGKGKLVINTRGENDKCLVEIMDNGSGLDVESMSKLFEPYFTSKPKGNGLGLTNTQNIILNHKGSIHVESNVGKGTKFTITLNFA